MLRQGETLNCYALDYQASSNVKKVLLGKVMKV